MSISRSGLTGKLAYNPDGSLVGEVVDTAFVVGSNNFSLLIKVSQDLTIEIPWDLVAAGKDILITKEVVDPAKAKQVKAPAPAAAVQQPAEQGGQRGRFGLPKMLSTGSKKMVCPSCGKDATWIKEYSRWYCENEKKYL